MDKAGLQPAHEVRLRVPPLRTRRQHVLGSPTLLHRNLQPDLIIKTAGFRGASGGGSLARCQPWRLQGTPVLKAPCHQLQQGRDLGGGQGEAQSAPGCGRRPLPSQTSDSGSPAPTLNLRPSPVWPRMQKAMVQFQWHDGTVKNIHVDPPFLYEYQVSEGAQQSEQGVPEGEREGAPWAADTGPLPELSLVNGLCSAPGQPLEVVSPWPQAGTRRPQAEAPHPVGQAPPPPLVPRNEAL